MIVTVAGTVTPPPTDTTAPTVAITNPGNGSLVKGLITVSAKAGDNVGVASLSLYLDGAMVSAGNSSSVSFKWNTRKAASGAHTISATAKDSSGNQSSTTIQVKK